MKKIRMFFAAIVAAAMVVLVGCPVRPSDSTEWRAVSNATIQGIDGLQPSGSPVFEVGYVDGVFSGLRISGRTSDYFGLDVDNTVLSGATITVTGIGDRTASGQVWLQDADTYQVYTGESNWANGVPFELSYSFNSKIRIASSSVGSNIIITDIRIGTWSFVNDVLPKL